MTTHEVRPVTDSGRSSLVWLLAACLAAGGLACDSGGGDTPGDDAQADVSRGGDVAEDASAGPDEGGELDAADDATGPDGADPADATEDVPTGPVPSCVDWGAAPEGDPSAAWFPADCVVDVTLTMDPTDWSALREGDRSVPNALAGADCLDGPIAADALSEAFDVTVTVGDTEMAGAVVQKIGFLDDLSETKPSLRIALAEPVAGLAQLELHNATRDEALVRECLALGWMRGVGLPAPRCGFVRLAVNAWTFGVYVHVETVDAAFAEAASGGPVSALAGAMHSDFSETFVGTWRDLLDGPDAAVAAGSDAAALVDDVLAALAVEEPPPAEGEDADAEDEGSAMVAAVAEVVDVAGFARLWAAEVLLGAWDGYAGRASHVAFWRATPDGPAGVVPTRAPVAFEPPPPGLLGEGLPVGLLAHGELARRLYETAEGRDAYFGALGELVEAWDTDAMEAELERLAALVAPFVPSVEASGFDSAVELGRQWIVGRAGALAAWLPAATAPPEPGEDGLGGVAWPYAERPTLCWPEVGTASAEFQTAWETATFWNPLQHPGSLDITWTDADAGGLGKVSNSGASAYLSPLEGFVGDAAITVAGKWTEDPDNRFAALVAYGSPLDLAPNTTWPIDGVGWKGELYSVQLFDGAEDLRQLECRLVSGTIAFEEASASPGDLITGTFEGVLVDEPPPLQKVD